MSVSWVYEDADEDFSISDVLHGDLQGYTLVQLKYSSVAPRPPITLCDFKKIISRLQESVEKVRAKGRQITAINTHFHLTRNGRISLFSCTRAWGGGATIGDEKQEEAPGSCEKPPFLDTLCGRKNKWTLTLHIRS